jgi:hypothetical protein
MSKLKTYHFMEHRLYIEVEIKSQRMATKEDIAKLDFKMVELDYKLSENKYEILKWMFIYCVTQTYVTLGCILLLKW